MHPPPTPELPGSRTPLDRARSLPERVAAVGAQTSPREDQAREDQARDDQARVRLRCGRAAHASKTAPLKALWRWVQGSPSHPQPQLATDPVRLQVEVATQTGRPLFALRDPEGTVDLSLGPGTYDITVVQGSRRRIYTVPLDAGATIDLDLHGATLAR